MSWRHANRARRARAALREPKKLYAEAYDAINRLEQNVVATIVPEFTLEDTKRAFWPDDTVDKLTAAFPLVQDGDRSAFSTEVPLVLGDIAVRCQIGINLPNVRMLCPLEESIVVRAPNAQGIFNTLTKVHREFMQFNIVRDVVDWLNDHANHVTPSAAKYLCPWLPALLPSGHAVTQVDGKKFTLPRTTHPAELMRKAGSVLALAHMAPKKEDGNKTNFTVYFLRDYKDDRGTPRESEIFGLL